MGIAWGSLEDESSDDCSFISVDEGFILLIGKSVFQGEFLKISFLLFLLIKLLDDLDKLVVLGPKIGFEFGKDEDSIDIDFEGAKSWEMDELFGCFIEILALPSGWLACNAAVVRRGLVLVDDSGGDGGY